MTFIAAEEINPPFMQLSDLCDLDCGSGSRSYYHSSLIKYKLCTKFHKDHM